MEDNEIKNINNNQAHKPDLDHNQDMKIFENQMAMNVNETGDILLETSNISSILNISDNDGDNSVDFLSFGTTLKQFTNDHHMHSPEQVEIIDLDGDNNQIVKKTYVGNQDTIYLMPNTDDPLIYLSNNLGMFDRSIITRKSSRKIKNSKKSEINEPITETNIRIKLDQIITNTSELLRRNVTTPPTLEVASGACFAQHNPRQKNTTKKNANSLIAESGEIMFEESHQIKLLVRYMGNNNRIHTIKIDPNHKLETIFDEIIKLENIGDYLRENNINIDITTNACQYLKLQYKGEDLPFFSTAQHCGLKSGALVECLFKPGFHNPPTNPNNSDHLDNAQSLLPTDPAELLKLKIQYGPGGKSYYETLIQPTDNLNTVASKLAAHVRINPTKIKLFFDGELLEFDSGSIQDLGLEDGDVLDAVF
ncbi:unnamed protein product [Gordionus sp. m RMFG-2023]